MSCRRLGNAEASGHCGCVGITGVEVRSGHREVSSRPEGKAGGIERERHHLDAGGAGTCGRSDAALGRARAGEGAGGRAPRAFRRDARSEELTLARKFSTRAEVRF